MHAYKVLAHFMASKLQDNIHQCELSKKPTWEALLFLISPDWSTLSAEQLGLTEIDELIFIVSLRVWIGTLSSALNKAPIEVAIYY